MFRVQGWKVTAYRKQVRRWLYVDFCGRPSGRLYGCRCPAARHPDENPVWSPGVAVEPPKPNRLRDPTCQGTPHQPQALVPRSLAAENFWHAVASSLISHQNLPAARLTVELVGTLPALTAHPDRLVGGVLHIKERKPPKSGARKAEAMPEMVAAIVLAGLGLATAAVNLAVAVIELRKQRNRTPRRRCKEHRRGHAF